MKEKYDVPIAPLSEFVSYMMEQMSHFGTCRIGAEVRSPSTVSFCRMQLLEGRLCRFGARP